MSCNSKRWAVSKCYRCRVEENALNCEKRAAYITSLGAFLPNDPVHNDDIEKHLGLVNGNPSRYKDLILNANGIVQRYYAFDRQGQQTHLNEQLAANAVQDALRKGGLSIDQIEMLATATTCPDLIVPGFASMVHGRLGGGPMDILSAGGVCVSSMAALKSVNNSILANEHDIAVAVGSELASVALQGSRFEKESQISAPRGQEASYQYFNADFLRWMLSDGAGAAVVQSTPRERSISLKIEWITLNSYAHKYPACMYLGSTKTKNLQAGDTYQSYKTISQAEEAGLMLLRQDTDLLAKGLSGSVLVETEKLMARGMIKPDEIDHFLPHISSYFFFEELVKAYLHIGFTVPTQKWFTNLASKGNVGSASIYLMLEEALGNGMFKAGDKVLCMVPESGRFSIAYALLTCVEG